MNKIQALFALMQKEGVHVIENGSTQSAMKNGTPYCLIKVQDLGRYFELSNPAETFRSFAKWEGSQKYFEKIKQPTGRPALYIAEPLFYSFIMSPNNTNPKVRAIQDWMFCTVLPSIIQDHVYTPNMEKE